MNSTDLEIIESIVIPILNNRERVSDYLPGNFNSIYSKKGVKKAIKRGLVTINGKKAYTADYVFGNERIDLFQSPLAKKRKIVNIILEIVYEDDYLAVINKPAGILVSGNKKYTIENALSLALEKSKQQDGLVFPLPIHRLDYPTSGLLLIGKTS
ncbi:pseudouridine synthase, partial [Flavobacteriaceae bacterium]|nr:pseudouridine synthase [Flavobacteriaceae bacterium]